LVVVILIGARHLVVYLLVTRVFRA
jgi:hypothetical protein